MQGIYLQYRKASLLLKEQWRHQARSFPVGNHGNKDHARSAYKSTNSLIGYRLRGER
jgi:hypothetical protein